MEVRIEGRNLAIGQRLRLHIIRKLAPVERHLPSATEALVELTSEPTRSQQERALVQISLSVNGVVLRAERRGPTALAAVNGAVASLGQAVTRYKGHAYRSLRSRQYLSIGEQQAADMFESDRELARELLPAGEETYAGG